LLGNDFLDALFHGAHTLFSLLMDKFRQLASGQVYRKAFQFFN